MNSATSFKVCGSREVIFLMGNTVAILIPFILESAWLLCKLKAEENAEGWALHRPSQAMERRAGML